jgi:hypothetical protein
MPAPLASLAGRWHGTSRLVLSWKTPSEFRSESTAEVRRVAGGRAVTVTYTWAHEGKPCEGFLLVARDGASDAAHVTWMDSWHQRDRPMHSAGTVDPRGGVEVRGSYPAPPGPDWGWRTLLAPTDDGGFTLTMYNVAPDGAEELAFENVYGRE